MFIPSIRYGYTFITVHSFYMFITIFRTLYFCRTYSDLVQCIGHITSNIRPVEILRNFRIRNNIRTQSEVHS